MPFTEEIPKCFAPVAGKPILSWIVEALNAAQIQQIVFIGGYKIEKVRETYPHFTFYHNTNWEQNNILTSLFYAEEEMKEGFLCSYADILYRPVVVQKLLQSKADITLAVDTAWRQRYQKRHTHPETDAEKVLARGDRVIAIGRHLPSEEAWGEYMGVAKFSPRGAALLRHHYHRVVQEFDGKPFQKAPSIQKAYLIDMFQELLDQGVTIQKVDIAGQYMEIDTTEDYLIALQEWR